MSKDVKKGEPMDPTFREGKTPEIRPNHQRVCYAAKTLVAEVLELFPETPVEYSNYDGRNTALDVTFDLTALDDIDGALLGNLLNLTYADPRVADVICDIDSESTLISFRAGPRTQDIRDSFGMAEALSILTDADQGEESW